MSQPAHFECQRTSDEGNVYSPEFWSNSFSNVYSSRTFSVILQGQIWSSLFGDVNNPQKDLKTSQNRYSQSQLGNYDCSDMNNFSTGWSTMPPES